MSLVMVKHGGRRKPYRKYNSKFQALPVSDANALGTLADNTILRSGLTSLTDDFWVQSADLAWAIDGLVVGEGPILVGLAHGDLSITEIKEAIQASPTNRGDIVAREQARRPVRRIGMFNPQTTGGSLQLNHGEKVRTVVKMYLAEGIELNAWAFNLSGSVLTTGAVIRTEGVLFGEWR